MPEQKCPTCGAQVRVVGKTTMHYEPIDHTPELIQRIKFKARDLINIQNYENEAMLGKALEEFVVWADSLECQAQTADVKIEEISL